MAKKYELRRREVEQSRGRAVNPYASPRCAPDAAVKTRPQSTPPAGRQAGRGVVVALCGLLALGSVMVFAQTARHQFLNLDDNEYLYENVHIQRGLTPACAWWAITQAHSANWHPLTWMLHALDWQLFGTWDPELGRYIESWPGGHHLVNALLHTITVVLLFLTLQAMTGATWPSAAVAALFAIHPLRAESVAFATGLKDMLSALFFVLTLAAYRGYAVRPFSWWRYLLVVACFALGLTAKPALVTLPFLLFLLDYWPLERLFGGRLFGSPSTPYLRLLLEKVPLVALSIGSCLLTMWAQSLVGAFKPLEFRFRLGNAVVSYAMYIVQMFYPAGMVLHYPHPGPMLKLEDLTLPLAILLPITVAVVWFGRQWRYLPVGWFWYLGMLVPMIGLVQVGAQARADRYTYLTQIGLYIMVAWGLRGWARAWRGRAAVYAVAAAAILASLAIVAWKQTSYWKDNLTLWGHCIACQPDTNDFAQNSYGNALNDAGRMDEANEHFAKAIAINPKYFRPRCNLAGNLYKQGRGEEALTLCNEGLEIDPDEAELHFLKAVALWQIASKHGLPTDQVNESVHEFRVSLDKDPKNEQAHNDLAEVYRQLKRYPEARAECRTALDLKPEFPEAHRTMGNILLAQGDLGGAEAQFRTALKLKPADPLSHQWLADVLWQQGKFKEAVEHRKQQIALEPGNIAIAIAVARGLTSDPRPEARFGKDALEIAKHACEQTDYKDIFALEVLASAYAETGDFAQAEAITRKAAETPLGQTTANAAVLQVRIQAYHMHVKPPIAPPTP